MHQRTPKEMHCIIHLKINLAVYWRRASWCDKFVISWKNRVRVLDHPVLCFGSKTRTRNFMKILVINFHQAKVKWIDWVSNETFGFVESERKKEKKKTHIFLLGRMQWDDVKFYSIKKQKNWILSRMLMKKFFEINQKGYKCWQTMIE